MSTINMIPTRTDLAMTPAVPCPAVSFPSRGRAAGHVVLTTTASGSPPGVCR